MKKILNKFNWFEWAMIIAVIGFTIYFSVISEGVSLLYLIIDGIAAISGIFCVVLCAKGRKSQYIWGVLNVLGYVIIAFINKYYGEVMLNALYYLPSQFIGYYLWNKNSNQGNGDVVGKKLTIKQSLILVSLITV
jgi:nicotinamide mononucleotide transporter